MKKIKLLLFVLTIMMFVTTSFEDICRAAEVTRINQPKGQIFINEGKDAGFIFGAKVCFSSSSSEKPICGKVMRTSASSAVVRVKNKRETKKIEIGAEAVLYVGNEDEK
jgi:ribosomal protein L35AE/L33A